MASLYVPLAFSAELTSKVLFSLLLLLLLVTTWSTCCVYKSTPCQTHTIVTCDKTPPKGETSGVK